MHQESKLHLNLMVKLRSESKLYKQYFIRFL